MTSHLLGHCEYPSQSSWLEADEDGGGDLVQTLTSLSWLPRWPVCDSELPDSSPQGD